VKHACFRLLKHVLRGHSLDGHKPIEILLVEDSASDAALIQEFLKASKLPNRVQRVEDGQLALDYLQRRGRYTVAPSYEAIP